MVKIKINEKEYEVEKEISILDAATKVGIEIPHFCSHTYLEPSGNCRMCLVEIKGIKELQTACTTLVKEGMEIFTESESVNKARKEILELHLANHPMDCPECDQAGECLLQDYYDKYGFYERRFFIPRFKKEKLVDLGKNLILDRERCILCLRCVRFSEEILGEKLLTVLERGANTYISIFGDEKIENNYSGNFAEICPVGAILDKNFRFKIRAWFLEKNKSICPLCSRGCNIFIESPKDKPYLKNHPRISRVSSRDNPDVNRSFICDIGRYELAYLDENRNYNPIFKNNNTNWDSIKKLINKYFFTMKTVILSSWMSEEEINFTLSIFKDYLNINNIYFWGRKQGEQDNILLKKDKNPNSYFLKEKKIPYINKIKEQKEIGDTLIFGNFFEDHPFLLDLIKKNNFVTTIAPYKLSENKKIDLLIPSANFFEKQGTYYNFEGKKQKIDKTFEPAESVRSEMEILKIIDNIIKNNE